MLLSGTQFQCLGEMVARSSKSLSTWTPTLWRWPGTQGCHIATSSTTSLTRSGSPVSSLLSLSTFTFYFLVLLSLSTFIFYFLVLLSLFTFTFYFHFLLSLFRSAESDSPHSHAGDEDKLLGRGRVQINGVEQHDCCFWTCRCCSASGISYFHVGTVGQSPDSKITGFLPL